jgi:hypothetical protein
MRVAPTLALTLVAAVASLPCTSHAWAREADAEPPLLLELTVAGEKHLVGAGETVGVDVAGTTVDAVVEPLEHRRFDNVDGMTFPYPTEMRLEYSSTPPVYVWRLMGPGYGVAILKAPGKSAEKYFDRGVEVRRKSYGKNVEFELDQPFQLGGRELRGLRVHMEGRVQNYVAFEGPLGVYSLSFTRVEDAQGEEAPGAVALGRFLAEDFTFPTDAERNTGDTPPLLSRVSLGGTVDVVPQDHESTVDVAGQPVTVKVSPTGTRRFDNLDGIRFQYPESFQFAYEPDDARWVIKGSGATLKVEKSKTMSGGLDNLLELRLMVWKKMYPTAKIDQEDTLRLGGERPRGMRVSFVVSKVPLVIDLVFIERGEVTYSVEIDRNLDAEGNTRPPALRLIELLDQTFEFPAK